jgi:hypothetical protein
MTNGTGDAAGSRRRRPRHAASRDAQRRLCDCATVAQPASNAIVARAESAYSRAWHTARNRRRRPTASLLAERGIRMVGVWGWLEELGDAPSGVGRPVGFDLAVCDRTIDVFGDRGRDSLGW